MGERYVLDRAKFVILFGCLVETFTDLWHVIGSKLL